MVYTRGSTLTIYPFVTAKKRNNHLSRTGLRVILQPRSGGSLLAVEVPSAVESGAVQLLLPFGLNVQVIQAINAKLGASAPNKAADGISCSLKSVALDTLSDIFGAYYTAGEVLACTGLFSAKVAGEPCSPSQPVINSRSLPCLIDPGNNTLYGEKILNTHQVRNLIFRPESTAVNVSRMELLLAESPADALRLIQSRGITLYVTTALGDYWLDNFR